MKSWFNQNFTAVVLTLIYQLLPGLVNLLPLPKRACQAWLNVRTSSESWKMTSLLHSPLRSHLCGKNAGFRRARPLVHSQPYYSLQGHSLAKDLTFLHLRFLKVCRICHVSQMLAFPIPSTKIIYKSIKHKYPHTLQTTHTHITFHRWRIEGKLHFHMGLLYFKKWVFFFLKALTK